MLTTFETENQQINKTTDDCNFYQLPTHHQQEKGREKAGGRAVCCGKSGYSLDFVRF